MQGEVKGICLPLRRRRRRERGGRAMCPRFRAARTNLTANATAALSRWTHRVGVSQLHTLLPLTSALSPMAFLVGVS
jgi:hypothetical protein